MLPPDPDDVAQEVALQRLLGRHVTPRIVERRMRRREAARAAAEALHVCDTGVAAVDPARFPLIADRVAGASVEQLLTTHGIRSRTTLARRLRAEYETWRATCS